MATAGREAGTGRPGSGFGKTFPDASGRGRLVPSPDTVRASSVSQPRLQAGREAGSPAA